jgi:hypothetical protein
MHISAGGGLQAAKINSTKRLNPTMSIQIGEDAAAYSERLRKKYSILPIMLLTDYGCLYHAEP